MAFSDSWTVGAAATRHQNCNENYINRYWNVKYNFAA